MPKPDESYFAAATEIEQIRSVCACVCSVTTHGIKISTGFVLRITWANYCKVYPEDTFPLSL